jgi:hypothetical protein
MREIMKNCSSLLFLLYFAMPINAFAQSKEGLNLGPLALDVDLPTAWQTSNEINQKIGIPLAQSDGGLDAPQLTIVGPEGEVILGIWTSDWPAPCRGDRCANRKVYNVGQLLIDDQDFKVQGYKREPGADRYKRQGSTDLPYTFYVFSGLGDGKIFGAGPNRMYGGYSDTPWAFVKDGVYSAGIVTLVLRAKGPVKKQVKELFLTIVDSLAPAPGVQLISEQEFLAKASRPESSLGPSQTVEKAFAAAANLSSVGSSMDSRSVEGFAELMDMLQAASLDLRNATINTAIFNKAIEACSDPGLNSILSYQNFPNCAEIKDAALFVRGDRKANVERYLMMARANARYRKLDLGKDKYLCNPVSLPVLTPPNPEKEKAWTDPISLESYVFNDGKWRTAKGREWSMNIKCHSG